jgi:hypothetical protein
LRRYARYAIERPLLLVAGAVIALIWANVPPASYTRAARALELAINDVTMVFFFAIFFGLANAGVPLTSVGPPTWLLLAALFFATAAFPPGAVLDQAKMGALLSFVAAPLAVAGSRHRSRRRRPA